MPTDHEARPPEQPEPREPPYEAPAADDVSAEEPFLTAAGFATS